MSLFQPHSIGCVLVVLGCWLGIGSWTIAQSPTSAHNLRGVTLSPEPTLSSSQGSLAAPIEIEMSLGSLVPTDEGKAILVRGGCTIQQGSRVWTAPVAVIWETPSPSGVGGQIVAYLDHTPEISPSMKEPGHQETRPNFLVQLETASPVTYSGASPVAVVGAAKDPVYLKAVQLKDRSAGTMQQIQYSTPLPAPALPPMPGQPTFLKRRVTIGPRFLGDRIQAKADFVPDSLQPEYVITVTGGVNIVVENVPLTIGGQTFLTRIDLSADKAVVWTDANRMGELSGFEMDENTPFEVYLEGNIVVRQGMSKVKAGRAYYDIAHRRGLLIDAEIRTQIPEYDGTIRLRAAEVRQFSLMNFHARNAYFTTSEFGIPKYRIEASDIFLEERPSMFSNSVNPATGLPDPGNLHVTSHNNRLFLGDVPVATIPTISGPVQESQIPVEEFSVGYSSMFGVEVDTAFSVDGLFGIQLPDDVDLDLEFDVYSARGPAIGLRSDYDFIAPVFGIPARHTGFSRHYFIYDNGEDNLGLGRRNLLPVDTLRGQFLSRNRTQFNPFTNLFFESGTVLENDRNFREQYFEDEWDKDKDLENKISLERQFDNVTGSIFGSLQTNDFSNQTEWLPRADLTILGQPLFNSPIMWSSHSSVGYARLNQAEPPYNPADDPFVPLDYYADSEGLVAMSRHELSLPFNAGPFKVAPYVLGEVAHWSEDVTGQELTRWYGSAGVRGSIQFSKYMPYVQSSILGLNGLAHKVVFDADYYLAESTEDLANIPQYNAFEEDAQERFRSRFQLLEFGGLLPEIFDPRLYALRSGAGRSVTAPYHELVDDQHALRLGMHHRWQTKVGPATNPRIVDWMELDAGITFFPNAERDNFGEDFGLLTGRYAWHVGPRTSILASGAMDFFDMGQRVYNVGVLSQRSERGSVYFGYRNLEAGPIESQLLTTSMSYVMTPNLYVATFGASYDIAEGIDRGQSLTITRISENFLFHFGFGYDRSRDNVGVAISLEPKFGSYGRGSMQLNSLLGIQ